MRLNKPRHATVVAYLALMVALGGTAEAATGGTLLLGRSNSATSVTTLNNKSGTPVALKAGHGKAPLSVNSSKLVANLNAAELVGEPKSYFQRKAIGRCSTQTNESVVGINSKGAFECANVLEESGAIVLTADTICPSDTRSLGEVNLTLSDGDGYASYQLCQYY